MIKALDESSSPSASECVINKVLCSVLRNDPVEWPSAGDDIFFENFLEQARYHGIEALVCRLVKSSSKWDAIPGRVRDELLQVLRFQAVVEMVRRLDLLALLVAFREKGITVLLLKGGALSYTHYPEPYFRSRSDTDIFISPQHIKPIQTVFQSLGYQCSGPKYKSHQFSFFKKAAGGVAVMYDVHWRLSNAPQYARILSFKRGMERSTPILALDNCPTLCSEDALMLACIHRVGSQDHDPDRLIWLYDIHLLVSGMLKSELVQFAEKTVQKKIQSVCRDAVCKCRDCFATRIPEQVFEILSTDPDGHSGSRQFWESYLGLIVDDLRCLPDTASRLALVRELLVPSAEELLRKYDKRNMLWVPLLFVRYLFQGLLKRFSLH